MKVILGVIVLLLVGCTGMAQAQGEETDPKIAALTERVAQLEAENELQWEMILQTASDPLMHRMKWRAIAQEFHEEAPALALLVEPSSGSWNGGQVDFLTKQVELYEPSYVALGCLEGVEPTVAYFRDGVTQSYPNGIGPAGVAQWVIQLIDDEIKRLNSTDEEPSSCLHSYLYPESIADGGRAIDLYLAASLPNVPVRFWDSIPSITVRRAGIWFNETDRQQPLIIWLCEGSSDNPCGLQREEE